MWHWLCCSSHEPQCLISTSASEGDVSSLHKQTRRRFRESEGEREAQTDWLEGMLGYAGVRTLFPSSPQKPYFLQQSANRTVKEKLSKSTQRNILMHISVSHNLSLLWWFRNHHCQIWLPQHLQIPSYLFQFIKVSFPDFTHKTITKLQRKGQ